MNPTVSVLVPVYNAEDYLQECLDSLVSQTLSDIEVIAVNDGSTDSSLEILSRYARADERIVLIDKNNTGYGDSMNQALLAARGEYVGIVEPDDFVERGMFEKLLEVARAHRADLVKCNYYEHRGGTEGQRETDRKVHIYEEFGIPYDAPFCPRDLPEVITVRPCIWAGLYRLGWLRENHIDFACTPGASFQDTSFAQMCWIAAETAVVTRSRLLHYRVDNASSSVKSADKVFAICDEYARSFDFLRSRGPEILAAFGPSLNAMRYCSYLWNYNRISPDCHREFAERWSSEMHDAMSEGLLDRSKLKPADRHDLDVLMADPHEFCRRHVGNMEWSGYEVEAWRNASAPAPAPVADSPDPTAGDAPGVFDPDSPSVSVIVPVYNVERFIRECLESLLAQTFGDFEALVIDDGSSDVSIAIAHLVVGEDRRFRFFEKENGGLSSARNFGIERARGRYLLFLDSDDFYASDALARLYARAIADDLDYLDFTAHPFYDTKLARRLRDEGYYETRPTIPGVMSGPELFVKYQHYREYHCSACFHFIRRELLDGREGQAPLRFEEGIIHEDELFSPLLIARAKRAAYLHEPVYQRRIREESIITTRRGMRNVEGMFVSQSKLEEFAVANAGEHSAEFTEALCQRVSELREIIAEDALGVPDSELEAYAESLEPRQRVDFAIVAIQGARALARARGELGYRLGNALLAAPRFFKRNLLA